MSLENLWHEGIRRVGRAYHGLPEPERAQVAELCRSLVARKEAMQALSSSVDAAVHCAGCGGACCVTGKYHFTSVDLVAYLVAGRPLFAPLFDNGRCPYLAEQGCLMPAGYRPFNCITFNCERIEDRLSNEAVGRFYRLERELRHIYGEIRSIFPAHSADGPLLKDAP